jgi:hypothetical protein
MLNPFLFGPNRKSKKDPRIANEEQIAQSRGQPTRQAVTWHQLTLRLGRLLIRIGSKLTREESVQSGSGNLKS